jgi:aminobenzoyl-glutamate utilization protein B
MARENKWRDLDAAFCWHPGDVNEVRTGTNNSSIQVLYHFKGVAAHAAGEPHQGRSALDAVELMNVGVQFLREHMTDDCRVHYSILDAGGVSPNVVQAHASVLYMVRANKVADSVKLLKRVDKIAEGAALMTETGVRRQFIDGTAELLPNFTLEKLLYENFEQIGIPEYTDEDRAFAAALHKNYPAASCPPGIGPRFDAAIAKRVRALTENMTKPLNDFLMPPYSGTGFTPGSTDVGDVSWQTPTAQITTATWPANTPGHSWQVVACGKSGFAHKGMLLAGKVLAAAAIDLFTDKALLEKARAEFAERSAEGYVCPIEPDAVPTAL